MGPHIPGEPVPKPGPARLSSDDQVLPDTASPLTEQPAKLLTVFASSTLKLNQTTCPAGVRYTPDPVPRSCDGPKTVTGLPAATLEPPQLLAPPVTATTLPRISEPATEPVAVSVGSPLGS